MMKRTLIGIILMSSPMHAGKFDQRLQELNLEMSTLSEQKKILQQEISIDYRHEMQFEMQGQREFVEYEWHDLGESLKKAESAEHLAHIKEAEIHKIDLKIEQLTKEKNSLMQQEESTK